MCNDCYIQSTIFNLSEISGADHHASNVSIVQCACIHLDTVIGLHHSHKFLEIDLAVPVSVRIPQNVCDGFFSECALDVAVREDFRDLRFGNAAVAIAIEDLNDFVKNRSPTEVEVVASQKPAHDPSLVRPSTTTTTPTLNAAQQTSSLRYWRLSIVAAKNSV